MAIQNLFSVQIGYREEGIKINR